LVAWDGVHAVQGLRKRLTAAIIFISNSIVHVGARELQGKQFGQKLVDAAWTKT